MSTIYDNWPGLKRDYFVYLESLTNGGNLALNGLLFPSVPKLWGTHLSLPEKNVDWCPFFGSIKTMNSFITKLMDIFQYEDCRHQVGFYFDVNAECVRVVTQNTYPDQENYLKLNPDFEEDWLDEIDTSHAWASFPFSTSINSLSRQLNNLDLSNPKPIPTSIWDDCDINPLDWEWSGTCQTSYEGYLAAKSLFEEMYGRRLSDVTREAFK